MKTPASMRLLLAMLGMPATAPLCHALDLQLQGKTALVTGSQERHHGE
jgi:hypothetical protein